MQLSLTVVTFKFMHLEQFLTLCLGTKSQDLGLRALTAPCQSFTASISNEEVHSGFTHTHTLRSAAFS